MAISGLLRRSDVLHVIEVQIRWLNVASCVSPSDTTPAPICVALRLKLGTCRNGSGRGVSLLPLLFGSEFCLHSVAPSTLAMFECAVRTAGLAFKACLAHPTQRPSDLRSARTCA